MINERNRAREQEMEELRQALAQREDDLRVAREACDLYLSDFQRSDRERALAEDRAKKAEEDAQTMRVTRAGEVEAARDRGYGEGWDAAGVEYKKQVREIEGELHRDRFMDGLRFGHGALLNKLNLPEDSELRALPQPPPEELVLPEEEEEPQNLESQADPNASAPTEDA